MATKYKIKNWEKYQHYKDRNPPWIKLHVEILASEDWVTLADASKLLMVVCMIVAARNNGVIEGNPDYIKRVAYLDKRPDLTPLIECGFLEEVLADASESKQPQAIARPEKEAEGEKEKKDTGSASADSTAGHEVEAVKAYNDLAEQLAWPKCERLSASRKTKIRARLRECGGIDGWYFALAKAKASKFLRGETTRGAGHENWRPDIDFFLTESKFIKLMEGRYDGATTAPTVAPLPSKTDEDWRAAVRRFKRDEYWPLSGFGPQPGYGGCQVPISILIEFGLAKGAA